MLECMGGGNRGDRVVTHVPNHGSEAHSRADQHNVAFLLLDHARGDCVNCVERAKVINVHLVPMCVHVLFGA